MGMESMSWQCPVIIGPCSSTDEKLVDADHAVAVNIRRVERLADSDGPVGPLDLMRLHGIKLLLRVRMGHEPSN